MNYPSPRSPASTPTREWDYYRMASATPTPSPRPSWFDSPTPRRPATRAAHHTRASSYSHQPAAYTPRTRLESPRYNSYGDYCTVDVSAKDFSPPRRDGRHSFTYVRASTPHGESDEDEIIEVMGRTCVLPAQSRFKSRLRVYPAYAADFDGTWHANHGDYLQRAAYYADAAYARAAQYQSPLSPQQHPPPPAQTRPPTSHGHYHARRASASVPQRPATAKPMSSNGARPKQAPAPAKATEADARRHKIPPGYSLKNWDPQEEPILLLGSVFDANSLGKWIFDWTVYHEGGDTPIADIAGELWLLLIELSGNIQEAECNVGCVRSPQNREIVDDFLAAGERLMQRLRCLLKACEAPMLKAARKKQASLGKNSGVEFVETLFGRDRELEKTEAFMQAIRNFNHRFKANCREILDKPTA
ncbi:hypothetical protein CDD82_6897 [Ophiocordyceps australis]|uniref:Vegetative cell wall protein gp1 n=1 Tax=Ophiocordyceps australis TaxID=1399860 RepID=A0A2C5YQ10_9HYPO|nr:hypothetical protein CDD82_6897 [Ophiocordyceps australis]